MGRAKVKLELIAKERSRNTTFQKRKKGLKKKTYEFSTLCGVDACLIILGPKQGDRFVEPETWPENREDVLNIIEQFRNSSSEGPGKRHIGIPEFLEDQTKKVRTKLAELRLHKDKGKYPTWDDRINNLSEDQLKNLIASLDSKLELVKLMIDLNEGNHSVLNDVTGLIGYSVPVINQNPPPSYMDFSNTTTMDDIHMQMQMQMLHHHQPLSSYKPPDHNRHHLSIDYHVPLDPSLGNCYGTSSSIMPYHPAAMMTSMSGQIYYNPMLPSCDEKAMHNNTGGGSLPCYFSPNMQPMMHPYFAPPLHQINEFSDLQDYHHALDDQRP
ncbi:agamous-like MADS-box protein AGL82 [Macadamia integrifolia]|uniref:agamous-like MADS-box protein AGL82 n=1 Tax=Macadamia integrifolia TaxID=60698 RepID=UPI001C4F1B9F|nr:agamous-like MADS-box protein AGL82 [Macadamia integrifolia]